MVPPEHNLIKRIKTDSELRTGMENFRTGLKKIKDIFLRPYKNKANKNHFQKNGLRPRVESDRTFLKPCPRNWLGMCKDFKNTGRTMPGKLNRLEEPEN